MTDLQWPSNPYRSPTVRVQPLPDGRWAVGNAYARLVGFASSPEELIALIASAGVSPEPSRPMQLGLDLDGLDLRI